MDFVLPDSFRTTKIEALKWATHTPEKDAGASTEKWVYVESSVKLIFLLTCSLIDNSLSLLQQCLQYGHCCTGCQLTGTLLIENGIIFIRDSLLLLTVIYCSIIEKISLSPRHLFTANEITVREKAAHSKQHLVINWVLAECWYFTKRAVNEISAIAQSILH